MKSLGYRILFAGTVIFWLSVAITFPVARRIEKSIDNESKAITLLISSILSNSHSIDESIQEIKEIVSVLNFPVVITNEMGLPIAWASIDVPSEKFTLKMLYRPDLLKEDPDYLRLISWMGKLGEKHDPYEMKKGDEVLGYIYYGYPGYTSFLRTVPVIILGLSIIVFILLIQTGRMVHTIEVEAVWANFARGLAHQMGTPVSALMGWLDLIRAGNCSPEVVSSMEKDIKRLSSILQRFSRVGGNLKKEVIILDDIIKELLEELKGRFLKNVDVEYKTYEKVKTFADKELLSWALENLIKNSYEALAPGGKIWIDLKRENGKARIFIGDNGKGIPLKIRKKIFRESVSTKEHGWGIGLLLARKIVEEFHGGKVKLIKSEPFVETIFMVELNEETGD
ncbi:MAG: HAMP domain-containing sensor histidine kinase [candidate division WOR-3 bacterium]